jgi:hypothetical protein
MRAEPTFDARTPHSFCTLTYRPPLPGQQNPHLPAARRPASSPVKITGEVNLYAGAPRAVYRLRRFPYRDWRRCVI